MMQLQFIMQNIFVDRKNLICKYLIREFLMWKTLSAVGIYFPHSFTERSSIVAHNWFCVEALYSPFLRGN